MVQWRPDNRLVQSHQHRLKNPESGFALNLEVYDFSERYPDVHHGLFSECVASTMWTKMLTPRLRDC